MAPAAGGNQEKKILEEGRSGLEPRHCRRNSGWFFIAPQA
jgi:hypothetical protein